MEEHTIVIIDYANDRVHISKNYILKGKTIEDWLVAVGYDLDNIHYLVDPAQINISL